MKYTVAAFKFSSHTIPGWVKEIDDENMAICLAEVLIQGRRYQRVNVTCNNNSKVIFEQKLKAKNVKQD